MPAAKSQSPNKKKSGPSADDILLDSRLTANEVEIPTTLFGVLSFFVSLLPVYLAIFLFEVPVNITNLLLFIAVSAAVTFMLQKAYTVFFYSAFQKLDTPHSDIKSQSDANLLRSYRLELSMARTLFQINIIFLALASAFQLYIFKKIDPRASLLMAPMIAALVSWFAAYKTEETRKANLKVNNRDL